MGIQGEQFMEGKDRLIVALDVQSHEAATSLVEKLDNVNFFKIGWELFLTGDVIGLIGKIQERRNNKGNVFIDLKFSGDIGNTIKGVYNSLVKLNVKFITLTESVSFAINTDTIKTIRECRGNEKYPQVLMAPLLSNLDTDDLEYLGMKGLDASEFILKKSSILLSNGCDGLIVSGKEIQECNQAFPDAVIVSPGIRPENSSIDDHKRSTTPAEAIEYGADYLVVGRPITRNKNPYEAAQKIIDEIDEALVRKGHSATTS